MGGVYFEKFSVIRQRQKEWQDILDAEKARRSGRRKRWDIPVGQIPNTLIIKPTSPETQNLLKLIIKNK